MSKKLKLFLEYEIVDMVIYKSNITRRTRVFYALKGYVYTPIRYDNINSLLNYLDKFNDNDIANKNSKFIKKFVEKRRNNL